MHIHSREHVSIHARARRATIAYEEAIWLHSFNPRPRAAGDAHCSATILSPSSFNPRPRAAGDQAPTARVKVTGCFNPRPRAGGDRRTQLANRCDQVVSIHARARRATDMIRIKQSRSERFNPRPRAAGDLATRAAGSRDRAFQSTPPRGGRRRMRAHGGVVIDVSIHARARRATVMPRAGTCSGAFQSTPARGGRRGGSVAALGNLQFQSTPPRGGRHERSGAPSPSCASFQSTPARGGRRR